MGFDLLTALWLFVAGVVIALGLVATAYVSVRFASDENSQTTQIEQFAELTTGVPATVLSEKTVGAETPDTKDDATLYTVQFESDEWPNVTIAVQESEAGLPVVVAVG